MLPSKFFLFCLTLVFIVVEPSVYSQDISVVAIAHNLNNPRGLAVMPDGRILVEAGRGRDRPSEIEGSGQISILDDLNEDGNHDDEGERLLFLSGQASYNSLPLFGTFHDEVFGLSDIVLLDNNRLFFSKDDSFFEQASNMPDEMALYEGATGIYEVLDDNKDNLLIQRSATINALVFDPERKLFYAVESGFNQLMSVNLEGEAEVVAPFAPLAHQQQAVPAGVAYDSLNGDILVALFSGFVHDYLGTNLSFLPGDSKIVRFDPDSSSLRDEIIGLTTAIDVAVDEQGNIFVVELTTQWSSALMPLDFDLYDSESPTDLGGYVRFSGRVSMYPENSAAPIILAEGLDTPTNITYAEGRLYVSSGLGTPGRSVLTPHGIDTIDGVLYLIAGF
jgi:SMP-30/gluconolaconase/LRE-like protein